MKQPFLLLFTINLLLWNRLNAQELDPKYVQAVNYLKQTKRDSSFNVSPLIKNLGIDFFNLDSLGYCNCMIDSLRKEHPRKWMFTPYIEPNILKRFPSDLSKDRFLLFSKPLGDVLVVSLRRGKVNTVGMKTSYFGTAQEFLFIFDSENNIKKVLEAEVIYN